ncbi:retrotransposon protein, putative, ty1-copia subclass [Tanacetum coccineum]
MLSFFEKSLKSEEVSWRAVDLEEIQDGDTSPSKITSEIPMEVEGFELPQEEVIPVCRFERIHRDPKRLCLNVEAEEHSLGDLNEPTSYKAIMLDPESNKWLDAINKEMQSMIDNMVWVLVDLPPNCKTVRNNILKRYKMDNSKGGHIPMQERQDLNKTQGASTHEEVKLTQNILMLRLWNPLWATVVKNILKYLRNTKNMFLVYGGNPEAELRVDCYCDAGFKTDRDDIKFQTGYVFSYKVLGIASMAIIDRQLPFEYTVTSRSTDVTMLVLRVEKKMFVIEQPIPPAPVVKFEANELAEWNTIYDAYNEELRSMFEKQARMERFDLIQTFHACKQEMDKPVVAYDLKMNEYVEQLERLGYMLPQDLSVGLILNGLTSDFTRFVRNYNMHNMGKTIGELHDMLIEYEKGLPKKAETRQVMMIKYGKIQKANKKPLKAKGKAKDDTCHHCKEVGHWKRNYPIYLAELLKKKKQLGTASSSGFREARKLKQGSLYLYEGNGVRTEVEAIRSFDLVLPNGLMICLDNCHYAPFITRGVVSVHRLVEKGFVYCFTNFEISFSKNNVLYFNAIPTKHNLDSTYLWHCPLAHISKKRMKKLQQEGLLKSTDDESFDQCVSCLSCKMTRKSFPHHPERVTDLLGIIHTDVCGPLKHVSRQGASYFITFTDDYSRYGYVYLLKHKHEVFETFKVFKNEVENQLGKTIKALRSDRGGEYISQEFKDYLKACGIVQQHTPPYTPQHNGMSERRYRTLLDMVRSMMNLTTLPLSFWDYAQ